MRQSLVAWWKRLPLLLVLTCGCGLFSCETPIECERRELREASETPETLIYRALKIGIRSTPTKLNPDGPDAKATKINKLVTYLLATLQHQEPVESEDPDQPAPEPLSAAEYVEIAKQLYELREILRETDEDRYPTILHVLMADDAALGASMSWYGSTHEHMVFALAWLAAKQVPRTFRVYETGMIEPSEIDEPSLKLAAHAIRGATFLGEGWPWMCEEEMSGYLGVLEHDQAALLDVLRAAQSMSAAADAPISPIADDRLLAAVHAPGVLVRGLCRLQASEDEEDKEDDALEDLEAFLADAELLGLEGEAVWLVGAYVGIKRENNELALDNLRKLEDSELLGDDERELVRDAIEALEDREPGAALNAITDKLVLARIASSYIVRTLAKVEWRQLFEASEGGQKLLRLTELIAHEVKQVRGSLSTEQLGELGDSASRWLGEVGCGAD